MTEPTKPSNRPLSEIADELRRLLAATPAAERTAAVDEWVRARTQNDVPEEIAHQAMTLAEIYRAGITGMAESKLRKLVLVIHGIRDQGEWMEMVKERLQSSDVVVQPIDFEDLDAFRFMTGFGVSGVIAKVLTKIRKAKADHVGAELMVIAHSFGTFVVSRILREESDIRFDRAIFCGSVIPRDFRFDLVPHCPKIVNECGGRDIWPVVAQGFSFRYKYGAAGVWGLRTSGIEDRFHDSAHSDYLTPEFVDSFWKPYVDHNELVPSPFQSKRRSTPRGVTFLGYGWRLIGWGLVASAIVVATSFWLDQQEFVLAAKSLQSLVAIAWITLIWVVVSGVKKFLTPSKN